MDNHRVSVNPQQAYAARIYVDYSRGHPEIYTLDDVPANVYLFIDYHSVYLPDIGFPISQIIHSPDLHIYKRRLEQSLNRYTKHLDDTKIYNVRLAQHGSIDGYPILYTTRFIKSGESLHVPKGLVYWTVELLIQSSIEQLRVAYPTIKEDIYKYGDSPIFEEYLNTLGFYLRTGNQACHPRRLFNSQQFI